MVDDVIFGGISDGQTHFVIIGVRNYVESTNGIRLFFNFCGELSRFLLRSNLGTREYWNLFLIR